jgi:hypothetical protein
MQEKGYKILGLYFKLPFSPDVEEKSKKYFLENKAELKVLDYTKGDLLQEYLERIKSHKFKVGTGVNPCLDCKIFMFKKAKEIADYLKIKLIVSGEVLGERPMSQMLNGLKTIEEESELKGRIFRPLSAKLLDDVEEINKNEFYEIKGRQRIEQMKLAKKFNINYPSPAGGCRLCEVYLKNRFKFLFKENLINEKTLPLVKIGRHFNINNIWFIVGKDEKESTLIEEFNNHLDSDIKTPAVYYNKKEGKETAIKLQKAYKEKNPKLFEEYKL